MRSDLIILTLLSLGVCSYGQREPGLSCIVEQTQSNGTCKFLDECPTVLDDIRHNVRGHTRCGFVGKMEIVCCPKVNNTTTGTSHVKIVSLRISEKKCDEYKSAVFEEILALSLVNGPPKKISVDKCVHNVIPIVFNHFPRAGEYPHMAVIAFDFDNGDVKWLCSGTLISDEYVLTAAQCFSPNNGDPKYVRLGELNFISEDDSSPEDYNITKIIIHPEYTGRDYYNDIALLQLDRKVKLSPYKRPACLPTTFDTTGTKMISTAWSWDLGSDLLRLRYAILEKITTNECNATYMQQRKLQHGIQSDTQICAGLRIRSNAEDFGRFHSGGALQIYHPDKHCMYVLIGVGLFGAPSGSSKIPEVYTRVFPYLDWIESVVWKNNS